MMEAHVQKNQVGLVSLFNAKSTFVQEQVLLFNP